MKDKIIFKKIKNKNVFMDDYEDLSKTGNAEIVFKKQPNASGAMAVIYAPNGTGKSSLAQVLAAETSTSEMQFEAIYDGSLINCESEAFHVIGDQWTRNIIKGETSDYLVGADIQREYELKKKIEQGFQVLFKDKLPRILKDEFKVSKRGAVLLSFVAAENGDVGKYLKDLANNRSKGDGIDWDEFIDYLQQPNLKYSITPLDKEKREFVINDCAGNGLLEKIKGVNLSGIVANKKIIYIERDDDAIKVLEKYKGLSDCIVCDNKNIDGQHLLTRKTNHRRIIYDSLDEPTKELLEKVVKDPTLAIEDPFDIKTAITDFIVNGNDQAVSKLLDEYALYVKNIAYEMINTLVDASLRISLVDDYKEYKGLQSKQPEIDDEDLLYIKEIISDYVGVDIELTRDVENDNNFKLMLSGKPFLNVERETLALSTGEQNFISLAFELLFARRSDKEFVVLDDPISSFDSIYKNKIAFCIVKFLENKKQIIFTHNTDLIRLLEVQKDGCFNLHLLNNTEGGKNGFILVKEKERKILISLYELIKLFRNRENELDGVIRDEKQFLMSMIPFIRGYVHVMKDENNYYEKLSGIMHGYEPPANSVDVAEVYKALFDYEFESCAISVEEILTLDCTTIDIMDDEIYPLLAETLKQTLIYYHLRMKVEKELVDTFNIVIKPNDSLTLNQIIQKALGPKKEDSEDLQKKKRDYRVFLTSRKTLMNEFNHFEGNMSIFQPAIDIKMESLNKEVERINEKLNEIKVEFA